MASTISIIPGGGQSAYTPGETIAATVEWSLESEPEAIEVRLVWNTSGRASEHVQVADATTIRGPGRSGRRQVELHAPEGPYSFDGQLVSLTWAIEAMAGELADTRTEIVVAPGGVPVQLHGQPGRGDRKPGVLRAGPTSL